MSNPLVSSGEEPIVATGHDWTDVLEVPEDVDVNWLCLINEGNAPGFWRLLYPDGESTPPVRIPGVSTTSIPVPDGFAGGKLQVKRTIADGDMNGLFAWAPCTEAEDDFDEDEDGNDDDQD